MESEIRDNFALNFWKNLKQRKTFLENHLHFCNFYFGFYVISLCPFVSFFCSAAELQLHFVFLSIHLKLFFSFFVVFPYPNWPFLIFIQNLTIRVHPLKIFLKFNADFVELSIKFVLFAKWICYRENPDFPYLYFVLCILHVVVWVRVHLSTDIIAIRL